MTVLSWQPREQQRTWCRTCQTEFAKTGSDLCAMCHLIRETLKKMEPQPPIDKPGMFRAWKPIFNALGWIVGIAVLWFVRSRL